MDRSSGMCLSKPDFNLGRSGALSSHAQAMARANGMQTSVCMYFMCILYVLRARQPFGMFYQVRRANERRVISCRVTPQTHHRRLWWLMVLVCCAVRMFIMKSALAGGTYNSYTYLSRLVLLRVDRGRSLFICSLDKSAGAPRRKQKFVFECNGNASASKYNTQM